MAIALQNRGAKRRLFQHFATFLPMNCQYNLYAFGVNKCRSIPIKVGSHSSAAMLLVSAFDLAPPVIDLTAQGFTLIDGRIDYIDGKPVAVIVYRRRVHVINLFVTQGLESVLPTPKLETFQGFNVLRWTDRGLGLMAVSDLNQEELKDLAAKFEAATRAG